MIWSTVELGELCKTVTKGTTPRTMGKDYVSSGIPFLRAENLQGDAVVLDEKTLFIDNETDKALARSRIFSGDVLISIAGTIGRAAIVPEKLPQMNCNQAVAIVRIDKYLEPRFFLHWLKTQDSQAQMTGARVTQTISNLSLGQIKRLKIPLPPLSEQRRIVEILDQADALRKKRAEANAKVERILPALFIKMFGDPVANPIGFTVYPLKSLIQSIDSGINFSPVPENAECSQWRVLKISAITTGIFKPSESKPISPDVEFRDSMIVKRGDFLMSRANTSELVGAVCVVRQDPPKLILSDKTWRLSFAKDSLVNKNYLLYVLQHSSLRYIISSLASGTSGSMQNISKRKTETLPIPVPSIEQQEKFSTAVEELEQLRVRFLAHSRKIETLFQILLHRAFSGELTAEWRKAHMAELLQEMEHQARVLGLEHGVEYEQLGMLE